MKPEDIRNKVGRFRILVVGRANAGKTTLLQRVCNTTEDPEIFDGAGEKIDAVIVESSVERGHHDISNELVFRSNQNFVFHDSCGFEAGGEGEFKKMKEFVFERASTLKLKERIHAIWYCIPMNEHHRAITTAEERFFSECNTSGVPVVAVFTKFDALWDEAYGQLRESGRGLTRAECKRQAPDHAKEIFAKAKTWDRLCQTQYPPKFHICLAEMHEADADCGALLECTTDALGDEAMQILLISTQQTNLALCIKYAVEKVLMVYIRKACASTGTSSRMAEDTCDKMQWRIAQWFPHTKELDDLDLFRRRDRDRRDRLDLDFDPDYLLNGIQLRNSLDTESALLTLPKSGPSHIILQSGIAVIIILEYSFFLLQEGKQQPENVLKLAATEYRTSQTQAAIEDATKKVLSQDDEDDAKLCHMVIDIILQHRISKVSLAEERK